jgi:hypothetical protein
MGHLYHGYVNVYQKVVYHLHHYNYHPGDPSF